LRRLDLRKAQAARLNTIRDINRQIVLNYVREREPISRAEIARETDLQRSTISAIVEDLKTEGLVEEVGEGESTGGRRPTLLKLRAAEPIALGVSITPTCTTIATAANAAAQRNSRSEPVAFVDTAGANSPWRRSVDCANDARPQPSHRHAAIGTSEGPARLVKSAVVRSSGSKAASMESGRLSWCDAWSSASINSVEAPSCSPVANVEPSYRFASSRIGAPDHHCPNARRCPWRFV